MSTEPMGPMSLHAALVLSVGNKAKTQLDDGSCAIVERYRIGKNTTYSYSLYRVSQGVVSSEWHEDDYGVGLRIFRLSVNALVWLPVETPFPV
jgi:hypothetical protein